MSKSNTPTDHPANGLIIGSLEQRHSLSKIYPIHLSNKFTDLKGLREDFKYIYVINWLYQCRGYIKLSSEYFDNDLFEIELLNMVNPAPIDDMILFINKLKLSLISKIQGKKIQSLNMFEPIFRMYFGSNTPLGGSNEDDENETNFEIDVNLPKFDNLNIKDKIEIFYLCIKEIVQYQDFRDFIDKNKLSHDLIRLNSIYLEIIKPSQSEDYTLCFNDTCLYKRIITYPNLSIPKKRKLSPSNPEIFFKFEQFDIIEVKFELVYSNIYEFSDFLKSIKMKKSSKFKSIYNKLSNKNLIENYFNIELKKRKIITNRRKDFEMSRLIATRKKSSRLQAKEQERIKEEQERKLQEEEDLKFAAQRRFERRQSKRLNDDKAPDYTAGLSREERLNLRYNKKQPSQPIDEKLIDQQAENSDHVKQEPTEVLGQEPTEALGEEQTEAPAHIQTEAPIQKVEAPIQKIEASIHETPVQAIPVQEQDTQTDIPKQTSESSPQPQLNEVFQPTAINPN